MDRQRKDRGGPRADLSPAEALRREVSGPKPGYSKPWSGGSKPSDTRLQSTSPEATKIGARWIALGESLGYPAPFNDVWLGNQIAIKVTRDRLMQQYLAAGRRSQVSRLLAKMVDLFWSEYVDESVPAKDAASVFLENVWDDLRDYALSCLRAAWLKKHGKRITPPEYAAREEQSLQVSLQQAKVQRFLEDAEKDSEPPSGVKLDPKQRAVLGSARHEENGETQ